jgi:uncharacterized DUF497 family protein
MLIFYWNEWNIEHIAEHDVTPEEAKEVARGAMRPFAMNMGNGKWMVRGPTSHGRHLQVIYVYRGVEDIDLDSVEPEAFASKHKLTLSQLVNLTLASAIQFAD